MKHDIQDKKLIDELKILSNNKLKNIEDLEYILTAAANSNKIQLLESIAFDAKYISGLLSILKKQDNLVNEEYSKKIGDELISGYEKVKSKLKDLLMNSSAFINEIFENKYFQLTQFSLNNLNTLCEDLAYLKLFINDLKIKKDSN